MKKLWLVQIDFALLGLFLIGFACLPSVAARQAAAQAPGQPAAASSAPSSATPAGQPTGQSTAAAAQPAAAPPAGPPQPSGQVVEEIITRVNNQIITRSEFERSKDQLRDEVKQQDSKDPDKSFAEREKDVLRDLVDQQLLLDKGKDLDITGDTELIKQLDQMRKEMKLDSLEDLEKEATKQGISWEDFKQTQRNQIITRKVIGEEVSSHLAVTKEEEQAFYDEHKGEMEQPEFIRLSEILVAPKVAAAPAPTAPAPAGNDPGAAAAATPPVADEAALAAAEAKAKDLLKQIRDGASFEDIAKKYSDGPSAADGGALGMFKRGQLAKELEDRTFAMKSGEVTDVIRTKQGYVILKVDDHQMAGIPPMKDVLPKIQDALYYQKLQPALRAYLTKLREEAYIKYAPGYVDTGMSANQTQPIETASDKESDGKKLKKKHKKLGFL
ncbi:MAG: peptidylprolyl isomerase [Candidatus Sulfotelmatobacter sp.]|jgi:peptidyl-prolyl cis-trans isomerase SurA